MPGPADEGNTKTEIEMEKKKKKKKKKRRKEWLFFSANNLNTSLCVCTVSYIKWANGRIVGDRCLAIVRAAVR